MQPYRFRPQLKSTLWGGERIAPFKGISQEELAQNTTDPAHIGESWEISAVPGCESVVAEGGARGDTGMTLAQLIHRHKAMLVGKRVFERYGEEFPLLIKFIDAAKDLSMQVHPNDRVAKERHGCMGKTEMWYIIDAEPGALIHCGMSREIDGEEMVRRAHLPLPEGENPYADVVAQHRSQAGDIYFLPPGRVHAIGAGNLLAEIQQTSDITYRISDYGRRDHSGQLRQLHIEEAKDVIDYEVLPTYKSDYDRRAEVTPLVSCHYFRTHRIAANGQTTVDFHCDSFVVVMCMEGEAEVNGAHLRQGETLLVPACDNVLRIDGRTTLLTAIA